MSPLFTWFTMYWAVDCHYIPYMFGCELNTNQLHAYMSIFTNFSYLQVTQEAHLLTLMAM